MSLEYIVDGYNVIHNRLFAQVNNRASSPRLGLLECILCQRLTGSSRNRVTVVFDGYPQAGYADAEFPSIIRVIFSEDKTADERIAYIVEHASNPKNMVVVSDDNEIRYFIKSLRAKSLSVEEFFTPFFKKETRLSRLGADEDKRNCTKHELSFSQKRQINQELKKLWLK